MTVKELIEKIDKTIERKIMNTGSMGAEPVIVTLVLSDEEREKFYGIEKYDSEHYSWEFDGNELTISYVEDC